MDIAVYVLVTRDKNGQLKLAQPRRRSAELPFGFDPVFGDFLFDFAESGIFCSQDQDILLLKGALDISEIRDQPNFVDAFKALILQPRDFSQWEVLQRKKAAGVMDKHYRQDIMHHLKSKYANPDSQTSDTEQIA